VGDGPGTLGWVSGALFDPDYDPDDLVGTGRHLTKQELFTWTRFLDASRLIEEVLARHVADSHDMTHSDYEVLVRLDGFGGSLRMTELARQVVSSAQKLTHTANRLERRGWISRIPTETDRRGLLATITPEGRRALAAAATGHAVLIKRFLLDDLSPDEQVVIGQAMSRIATHLRVHRNGQPCERCEGTDRSTAP
jgi:DNA-binding MarR family transcriptional regulator